jgi:hypothetical protein
MTLPGCFIYLCLAYGVHKKKYSFSDYVACAPIKRLFFVPRSGAAKLRVIILRNLRGEASDLAG